MTIWLKDSIRNIGLLTVFLNLENVDRELALKMIKEIESEFFPDDDDQTNYLRLVYSDPSPKLGDHNAEDDKSLHIRGIELDENIKQINKIKQKVKDILIRNSISDYIVTTNPKIPNGLMVLKRSGAQSSSELHCRHCGMEFDDQIQLGNHLRIHYMI